MYTENPEVTMEEEAHLLDDNATEHAFMDWGWMTHLKDAEGNNYWIDMGVAKFNKLGTFGAMPFGKAPMDMWNFTVRSDIGRVYTPPGTIYKVAEFPQSEIMAYHPFMGGDLKIERDDENNKVILDIDQFHQVCDLNNNTWHATVYDEIEDIRAELTHYGEGYPMWYGKDKMHVYIDHMRAQGYNWSGVVEGELTIKGKKIKVKGFGGRERFYCPDQSNVEAGGWCDLVMFKFDEMWGAVCEMKLSNDKDLALYMKDEEVLFATKDTKYNDEDCTFNIYHDDWAYFDVINNFIPTTYQITLEVELGTLVIDTKVVGCNCLTQGENLQADVPNLMLDMLQVEGTFTYKDGRVKKLTNGFCNSNVVLWKTFPSTILNFGGRTKTQANKPTLE